MKRGKFSLSNTKLLSCNMGQLIPIGMYEVLPGDTIQHATSALVRAAPLLSPVMHPVEVRIHHWFVPYRLLWDSWEAFITGGPDGMGPAGDFPTITADVETGDLADYLGLPIVDDLEFSALPFRAYNLIFNEWYRDQDLTAEAVVSTASGDDEDTDTLLLNISWEKDYFTSARPWEQKGPSITVPIGTTAPVSGVALADGLTPTTVTASGKTWRDGSNASGLPGATNIMNVDWDSDNLAIVTANSGNIGASNFPLLYADLEGASAVTVNALREAMALQRYEENRARFGSRYVEYLRYLGVRSSDARLQRPEYLGGGSNTIQFSEVLQTADNSEAVDPTYVGQLRGHGIAAMRSNRYRRFFEEHGVCMSLMSIRPRTMYMQGMWRMWNRRTKEDFWQQELQHIGQQPVLNKEIYAAGASPEATFGYQDRYDEYRRQESSVAGEFRDILNYWHLARDFSSAPALNETFVTCTPTERVFAAQENNVVYVHAKHSVQARRLVAQVGKSFIF